MEDGRKAVLYNRAGNILYAIFAISLAFLLIFTNLSLASYSHLIPSPFSNVIQSLQPIWSTMNLTTAVMISIAPFLIGLAGYILKRISNDIAISVIWTSTGKELIVSRSTGHYGWVIIKGAEFMVECPDSILNVGDKVKLNEIHVEKETKYEERYDPGTDRWYTEETEHTYHIQEGSLIPFDKDALHHIYLVHLSEKYEAQKRRKQR